MIRKPEQNVITSATKRSSGFDIESLLAPVTTSQSTTTSNSKLTAKVQPFEVRENDLMESNSPRPENVFPKGPRNPPLYPSLGYTPFSSPFPFANHYFYSLWSAQAQANAGLINWPLIHTNPAYTNSTQGSSGTQSESNSSENNINTSASHTTSDKQQPTEDASASSNSATESLLAASECHLAVLQDDDGDTPLHIAIVHENKRLIEKLIGLITFSKLTLNTPNNLSQTTLHLAVLTDQPEVVRQLMTAGADPNAQDRNGQTAAHMCAARGHIGCLLEILKAKRKELDLEIKNYNGLTALHVAVQKKHKSIVEALIKCGVNLNAKDNKSGHTALHHAIDLECCEILQLLVAKGANINKPNYSGVTPVQNANCSRNDAISKIILSQDTGGPATPGGRPPAIQPIVPQTANIPPISTLTATTVARESENRSEVAKRRYAPVIPATSRRSRTSEVTK